MKTLDDGRVVLTVEEALARLPDGDRIHTFLQAGPMLVGANWDRADVVAAIEENGGADETGPQAQAMRHGLAVAHKSGTPLFIETRHDR